MSCDAETSDGLEDAEEAVGDRALPAGVQWECRRPCYCLSKQCGMKAESETAYCCCIHSVYSNEREVEGAAVSGCAARDAGQPAAERKPGVGFEVVVE